jgi:ADP-heptose:LPS heptosyltransferase
MPSYSVIPDVRKIAILRANGIGDFIFALPALEAIRAVYPRAEIVLLGLPWHKHFLYGNITPVDRVAVIPSVKNLSLLKENPQEASVGQIDSFFEKMRKEEFDLAIQMHGGGRYSNPFVLRLGARITAGLKTPDAVPLDLNLPYIYFQPEPVRWMEVVSLVGASPVVLGPRLNIPKTEIEEICEIVPPTSAPLVALNPGAGDPRRRWPIQRFAELGNLLAARGARIVLTGADFDAPFTGRIRDEADSPFLDLSGRLSLRQLAALFSRCSLVVSNDSGPLHVAQAAGAPTVGIFWSVNLPTAAPLTRRNHTPVVSWRLNCPECGANAIENDCGHQSSFVAEVRVDEVFEQAIRLLESESIVVHMPQTL